MVRGRSDDSAYSYGPTDLRTVANRVPALSAKINLSARLVPPRRRVHLHDKRMLERDGSRRIIVTSRRTAGGELAAERAAGTTEEHIVVDVSTADIIRPRVIAPRIVQKVVPVDDEVRNAVKSTAVGLGGPPSHAVEKPRATYVRERDHVRLAGTAHCGHLVSPYAATKLVHLVSPYAVLYP